MCIRDRGYSEGQSLMGKSASSTFRLYAAPAIPSAYMSPRQYFLRPRFGTRPPSDPSASNEWRKFTRYRDGWRKPARSRDVFLSQTYAEPPLARKRMKSRRSSGTMQRKRITKPPLVHGSTLLMSAPGHARCIAGRAFYRSLYRSLNCRRA